MKSTDHRKAASHNRNGRNRYEKGYQHHGYEGRNPLNSRKGDFANLKYQSTNHHGSRLADVWPRGAQESEPE